MHTLPIPTSRPSKQVSYTFLARINMKVRDQMRQGRLELPLSDALGDMRIGKVIRGESIKGQEPDGIAYCEIELVMTGPRGAEAQAAIAQLERLGAPKGSLLIDPNGDLPDQAFGRTEGLAVYMNGTSDRLRKKARAVMESSQKALAAADCDGALSDTWIGAAGTALYFYGSTFEEMATVIQPALTRASSRLAPRIERIA